mmetsp:Transcript_6620/g.14342  ORF Transcript_6620/g.14342 Transcript_6620/m.14342 type:complete len:143 (+) Transcript_6620:145-573(+)
MKPPQENDENACERNDCESINSKISASRQNDNDVTDDDLASMKLMIQEIRQNPDLLYQFCNIPGVNSRSEDLPDWDANTNSQNEETTRFLSKLKIDNDAKRLLTSKSKESYFCQECNSPTMPKCVFEKSMLSGDLICFPHDA